MNKFLVLVSVITAALARPDGLLGGDDGHVSVTQSSLGTYKYIVHLKDGSRSEERLADGTIIGEYTVPDVSGHPRIIKYISGRDGFRVLEGLPETPIDTSLPVAAPVAPEQPLANGNGDLLSSRLNLVVPVEGSSRIFSPAGSVPLQHVIPVAASSDLPLPVEDTPEVKAEREKFFALYNAIVTHTVA